MAVGLTDLQWKIRGSTPSRRLLHALNDQGTGAATSVADTSNTDLAFLLSENTEEGGDNSSSTGTESMAKSNGSTCEKNQYVVGT